MDEPNESKRKIRIIYRTPEFDTFYSGLSASVQRKIDYVFSIVENIYNIPAKFVKHIEKTNLYEMRVSVGSNEYRTIVFSMDNENIIEAKEILLLNGFLKKSSKDYPKQIEKANKILNNYTV